MSRNVTIGKFNVKGGVGFQGCGAAYHLRPCSPDKRKAPVQHAFVAQAPQELGKRRQLECLSLQRILRTLRRPYRQRFEPFALPDRRPGEQPRIKSRAAIVQALAFLDNALPEAPLRAVACPTKTVGRALQGQRDMARRQPDTLIFETGTRTLAEMPK
jgi:hypothetical protein